MVEPMGKCRTGNAPSIWILLVVALAAGACSDSSLSDLGQRASGWIGEPESGPVQTDPSGQPAVVRSVEVDWVNDDAGGASLAGDPAAVVQAVIARSSGPERYIQASRLEIAAALPGLLFPDLVPPEVTAVTSQLVVASARDRLDDEVHAAFGLWTVEPYTRSRSVGQRGTFTVAGIAADSACDRLAAGAVAACTTTTIDVFDVVRIDAESGQTWVWDDDTYEYQLFLRGALDGNEGVADFMIRNQVEFRAVADPTGSLLPDVAAEGDAEGGDGGDQ
jgi:hypothetical protein